MFLVKETGWSLEQVENLPIKKLHWWVVEAVNLHNHLNKSD